MYFVSVSICDQFHEHEVFWERGQENMGRGTDFIAISDMCYKQTNKIMYLFILSIGHPDLKQ